jgi:hypothetical protein
MPAEAPLPPTVWQLRTPCPRCERAWVLCLVACRSCSHVAVMCAGERVAFPSFAALGAGGATDPATTSCSGCLRHKLKDFPPATMDQIRKAGIDPNACTSLTVERVMAAAAVPTTVDLHDWRDKAVARLVTYLTVMNYVFGVTLAIIGIVVIVFWVKGW